MVDEGSVPRRFFHLLILSFFIVALNSLVSLSLVQQITTDSELAVWTGRAALPLAKSLASQPLFPASSSAEWK